MSRERSTSSAWDRARQAAARVKPVAARVKPLAWSTSAAATRRVHRTRAWAAPMVGRTGQILQDNVAAKVSAMLSSAAQQLEPAKPPSRRWRKLAVISDARVRRKRDSGSGPQPQEAGRHDRTGRGGRR